MPNPNISFNGQTLILPGAYYADNVSATLPATPPTIPPLIFIGYGYGGKPQTALPFSDPQSLLNTLRGGPCSGFVPFLANPSPQLNGAQIITYINPGENTQSGSSMSDVGGSGVAVLTSTNYGSPSNLLQQQVSTGSNSGKKVTLYDGYAGQSLVGDNLGIPFELAYTGTATGAVSFSVTASGLNATVFSVTSPNSGESYSISLSAGNYGTIAQLVDYLNGTGFYSAIPLGDGTLPCNWLDVQSAVTLAPTGSGGYVYSDVSAWLGSVIYWFNQYAANYATAAVSGSITSLTSGLAPVNTPFVSFTGAQSVPPTTQDYANALNLALSIPGWALFIDSNLAAIRSLGQAHVTTASQTVNGKWRRFFTGSNLGDTVTTTIANAQALDSIRCAYLYPGIYAVNQQTGVNQLLSGLYAAAAAAAMATGNPPATPLTNKALQATGVEVALTVGQINQLQQAGVMPVQVSDQTSIPTIISDMTTWQIDSNPENMFLQQVQCRDFLAYSLVNATQPYVGTIADFLDETRILNAAKQTLNALVYKPGNPNGILNSWDPATLQLVYTGAQQTAAIQVNVVLVGQNRFITIYVPIQPLNLTVDSNTVSATS